MSAWAVNFGVPSAHSDNKRPDALVFLSLEDWDDIWRRNQFVTAALARRHPKMKILFVGIPRLGPSPRSSPCELPMEILQKRCPK